MSARWSLVASLLLGGLTIVRRRRVSMTEPALRFYGVVAFLGPLIPNMTFYIPIKHLSAGAMSIIISLVPILVALGMDRFPPLVWLALVVMLAGVALVQPKGAAEAPRKMEGLDVRVCNTG
ncbi:MAG: EamA family transporter [Paracoccaceae bacterium]